MKYSKTENGQIAFKERRIVGRQRSMFIMFDGNKTADEILAATVGLGVTKEDVQALVDQGFLVLVNESPVAVTTSPKPASPSVSSAASSLQGLVEQTLVGLPASSQRTAKDVRMARDFMTNTVNTMFGQYTRLTFIEAVHACETTDQLRALFPEWVHVMSESAIGAKRLPELCQQLAKTL